MSLASPALGAPAEDEPIGGHTYSSPIDYMEGDWFTTTTIFDAAEDGSDMVLEAKQRCERSGTVGFSCTLHSAEGQLHVSLFWSMEPKGTETHGYYVDFTGDHIESRRGTWDPQARTWIEYSPGPGGGTHILTDLTAENQIKVRVFADDNGKAGVLKLQVDIRR